MSFHCDGVFSKLGRYYDLVQFILCVCLCVRVFAKRWRNWIYGRGNVGNRIFQAIYLS